MRTKTLVATLLFVASLCFVAIHDAYAAKRFGGGRSFGSKPAMQRSTTAPKQQQPGVTQNATAASTASKKSGMAGIFGGLLAGTLLGSLLFGDGDGGGGIFSLLMMALLLFGAYKVFMYMRQKNSPQPAGGPQYAQGAPQGMGQNMHYQSAQNSAAGWGANLQGGASQAANIPAGFQVEEFIEGAKMAFSRLQSSWDKRDLDDIALFTSPAVLEEVKKQLAEDDSPSKTDILLNNARLLSVITENNEETATVYFDVILRESNATDTTQAREVWHFVRPVGGGNWKLDGIQQVEN